MWLIDRFEADYRSGAPLGAVAMAMAGSEALHSVATRAN